MNYSAKEIRNLYLEYFRKKQHEVVKSSSLVPGSDPSLLFTNAGMVQFKDTFLGQDTRSYKRATSSQKCLRAGGKHNDLDNVGYTMRHHTFFEMLGNFSFGDYFKPEAINFSWKFVTEELSLPKERLWVTTHKDDQESTDLWINQIGLSPDRLTKLGDKSNFWAMSDTGPCGPCTEIFYDHGPELEGGPPGTENEDGDRYVEIWNLVFMQYERNQHGQLNPLPAPSVDTGMGLERITAVMQGVSSNYMTDLFLPLIAQAKELTHGKGKSDDYSLNVIADHIRSTAFLIADGVTPGNDGRSYVLKRIIRRAARHGYLLGRKDPFLYEMVPNLIDIMGDIYPELSEKKNYIEGAIREEEERFSHTLSKGMKIFNSQVRKLSKEGKEALPGDIVFQLYDTYGFPEDLTSDLARANNLSVDSSGFDQLMQEQKDRARGSMKFSTTERESIVSSDESTFKGYEDVICESNILSIFSNGKEINEVSEAVDAVIILKETPFYAESGGQVGDQGMIFHTGGTFKVTDTKKKKDAILHFGQIVEGTLKKADKVKAEINLDRRRAIAESHSATHLLHSALRLILGAHVQQRGSLVEPGRLRFDFSHDKPLSDHEIDRINDLVNKEVQAYIPSKTRLMPYDDAIKDGAVAFFDEKYEDHVRVLSIGNHSIELCGGTHVINSSDIGLFEIYSESSIASGVRRIEAYTGDQALKHFKAIKQDVEKIAQSLEVRPSSLSEKVQELVHANMELNEALKKHNDGALLNTAKALVSQKKLIAGSVVIVSQQDQMSSKNVRSLLDFIRDLEKDSVIVLGGVNSDGAMLVASVSQSLVKQVDAGEIVKIANRVMEGKGGGKPTFAQSGSKSGAMIDKAFSEIDSFLHQALK
jgi:alanyl-tRNA synthetase